MKITMMKAGYGDCFLIETKKNDGLPYNILVDGGTGDSYDGREKNRDYFFPYLRENKIDLMILTHIDDDHIKGIQRLFKDLLKKKHEQLRSKIMKVIYNSPYATALYLGRPYAKPQKEEQKMNNGNISASSAQNVQQLLCNLDRLGDEVIVVDDKKIKEKRNISEQGIKITFLSPTKETLEDYYKKYEIDIGKALKNKVDKAKGNISKCKIEDDYKETIEELKRNTDCEELTDYNRASIAFCWRRK
jgi:ribonuclease BN (tRNA processing enzyme)